jgi:hypothetical protein
MTLLRAPKAMPKEEALEVATAREEAEEAWFGSRRTPAKKPHVTTRAAARERDEGYCLTISWGQDRSVRPNTPAGRGS